MNKYMMSGTTMWLRRTITLWSNTTSSHVALVFFTRRATDVNTSRRNIWSASNASSTNKRKAMKWSNASAVSGAIPQLTSNFFMTFNISMKHSLLLQFIFDSPLAP